MNLLEILIELLGLVVDFSCINPNEKNVENNIRHLKKYQWFQFYLEDEKYRHLIIYDNDVRKVIGKFNVKKIDKDFYSFRCQEKLDKILTKKLKESA